MPWARGTLTFTFSRRDQQSALTINLKQNARLFHTKIKSFFFRLQELNRLTILHWPVVYLLRSPVSLSTPIFIRYVDLYSRVKIGFTINSFCFIFFTHMYREISWVCFYFLSASSEFYYETVGCNVFRFNIVVFLIFVKRLFIIIKPLIARTESVQV